MPIFSSIQDDLPRLRKVLYEFVELTNTIAFPVFLGMSVLATELIVVVFGEQWKPSIPVMQVLNIIGILYAGFYYNAPLIMAVGKPQWKLRLDVCRSIFYVTSFFIAVRWGIVAVAASYVMSAYIFAFVTILVIKKLVDIDIKTYLSNYIYPFIATVMMSCFILANRYFISQYWAITDTISLIMGTIIGLITYPLSIYLLRPQLFAKIFGIIKSIFIKFKKFT
jgi:PST family polysaccharide transporter